MIKYSDRDSDDAALLKRIMKNLGCDLLKVNDILENRQVGEKEEEEEGERVINCETVRAY